jgi:hypothetical protein
LRDHSRGQRANLHVRRRGLGCLGGAGKARVPQQMA